MKRANLSETDSLLLCDLLERPAHGYLLLQRHPELTRSKVYNSLGKLHRRGLLDVREQEVPDAPARQVYSVAARQKQRIARLLEESMRHLSAAAQESLGRYYASHDTAGQLQEIALRLLRASGSRYRTQLG